MATAQGKEKAVKAKAAVSTTKLALAAYQGPRKDIIAALPFEISCQVLASGILSIRDIARLSRVSRKWHALCDDETILQRAAYKWGFITDLAVPLAEHVASIKDDEQGYFKRCSSSWKKYCTACFCLEQQITGNHYSAPIGLRSDVGRQVGYPKLSYDFAAAQSAKKEDEVYQDVWRIKVDPEEHTLISTGRNGGIRVTDLDSKELLWSIPSSQTKAYPHLEGDKGYIIWDITDSDDPNAQLTVYKSERLCEDVAEPRRGHYRKHWTIKHETRTQAFRFKYPILATADIQLNVVFWNVETQEKVSSMQCPSVRGLAYIDFDDEFLFILGYKQEHVHAFERATGKHVWQITKGPKPVLMHYDDGYGGQDCDDHLEDAIRHLKWSDEAKPDLRAGVAYRPKFTFDEKSGDKPTSDKSWHRWCCGHDSVMTWEAIHMCEETNTLVFCTILSIVIMKDYKKVLRGQGKPELFVAIQMPSSIPRLNETDEYDLEYKSSTLSINGGRALWTGWANCIVDWKNAKRPQDIKITQLCERQFVANEDLPLQKGATTKNVAKFNPVKRLLKTQIARDQYYSRRARCSSSVLTRTAAYMVEVQSVNHVALPGTIQSKGVSGKEEYSDYFISCMRCWDFARSALYEFDRAACEAQVKSFKDFPLTQKQLKEMSDDVVDKWTRAGLSRHDIDVLLPYLPDYFGEEGHGEGMWGHMMQDLDDFDEEEMMAGLQGDDDVEWD